MDFGDALRAMREGKTVRRTWWAELAALTPDEYATLALERPDGWSEVFVVTCGNGLRTMFNPSHAQLLADDWETVDKGELDCENT